MKGGEIGINPNQYIMKVFKYRYPELPGSDWESFFADSYRFFGPLLGPSRTSAPLNRGAGRVEWFEDDENYLARVELPGVKKENLSIDVEDGLLRLRYKVAKLVGAEEKAKDRNGEEVLRCPEGVNPSGIEATLEHGILQLVLPKPEQAKPINIKIQ